MLEIRAEAAFEKEVNAERYPHLINSTSAPWIVKVSYDLQLGHESSAEKADQCLHFFASQAKLQLLAFSRLFTTVHMFKRTATAGLMQFFQQMTGEP